ncbi:uncharacterized protein LOC117585556 [Drosophila guanche]|uniref:Uncharacterized protein n=1 Tax=Drosophila guanche TaxID=7266 RepID=A0A3B0KH22_DROGU|nr:uncharacterized protein LOC117585556 [Drosophila guanche]SPP82968.1 Hypothetical predicted protein [Drosophila guanche]
MMPQSTLSSASASMSTSNSLSIARLGLFLCILGLVAAQLKRESGPCHANGEYCQMHEHCCSMKCMTYLNVCARKIDEGLPVYMSHHSNSIYDTDVKESVDQFPDIVEIQTLPNESEQTPQERQGMQCNPVGGPCNVSEECCSKRCHFYSHKCVT